MTLEPEDLQATVQSLEPSIDPGAWGGRWWNVVLPTLLRDLAAVVFLPLIVVVVCADVFGRYIANAPQQWSQELATLALLMLFVAAIPITTAADGHIRTETLYERYPPRLRAIVDAVSALFGAAFMGLIAAWQFMELPGLYQRDEGAEFIDIPFWPISLFVALAMCFGVLQLLVRCAQRLHEGVIQGGAR